MAKNIVTKETVVKSNNTHKHCSIWTTSIMEKNNINILP